MLDTATNKRLSAMLFDYQTTYRTDFHRGEINNLIITKYKPKKPREVPVVKPTKDIHTLSDWKGDEVPFSLLHRRKEITRTDPTNIPETWEINQQDDGLAEAIKTRPRVVMTPAVAMDDIEPRARALLLDNMYTSNTTKAQREAVSVYLSVRAPLPALPTPANPVMLPKLQPSVVPSEWRMQSVGWDRTQIRAHCNTTEEFWRRKDPVGCRKCDEMTSAMAQRKMQAAKWN